MENGGGGGGAAPTGCYKCGRPGHWSRDCPSNPNPNASSPTSNNNNSNTYKPTPYVSKTSGGGGGDGGSISKAAAEKPKKVPRSRPKLTPDLLLSNDGFGYILRHFPRSFKYHGRGREVSDLGNLLGLYADWHSRLLPYYSFDQFVHKVEQVGTTKRVRLCIRELRDRVANGGDSTNLHEPPVEDEISNKEQDNMNLEDPSLFPDDNSLSRRNTDDLHDEMLHEIYNTTTDNTDICTDPKAKKYTEIQISEEQKDRMEANRLKALERASAARARSSQPASSLFANLPVRD